jgi:hypothetical protein
MLNKAEIRELIIKLNEALSKLQNDTDSICVGYFREGCGKISKFGEHYCGCDDDS